MSLDPGRGGSKMLMKDARVGELVFDRARRSLWGIRHFGGVCSLVRVDPPYTGWQQVRSWPYGEVVYDLDLSPDGRRLSASVGEISGRQTLRVWDTEALPAGEATPLAELEFAGAVPSNFVFSPDGRFLYGSSYYSGVSNIFRYHPEAGTLEAVSNADTGFFRPIPREDGTLVVFRFTGQGFVPATIPDRVVPDVSAVTLLGAQVAEKQPAVKEWNVGSPAKIPFESLVQRQAPYHSGRSLKKESFYPIVAGYKDSVAVGDAVQLLRSHPAQPRPLRDLLLARGGPRERRAVPCRGGVPLRAWTAQALYNPADFYDLFGPTKTSRKGYSVGLGHERILVYDRPRQLDLETEVRYWGGLERLPDYQNIEAPVRPCSRPRRPSVPGTCARPSGTWTTKRVRRGTWWWRATS